MASILALRFLSFVLFFFMDGHSIGARDLKVELGDHKQVDSYGATPISGDEPYQASYKSVSQAGYESISQAGYGGSGHKSVSQAGYGSVSQASYGDSGYKSVSQAGYGGSGHKSVSQAGYGGSGYKSAYKSVSQAGYGSVSQAGYGSSGHKSVSQAGYGGSGYKSAYKSVSQAGYGSVSQAGYGSSGHKSVSQTGGYGASGYKFVSQAGYGGSGNKQISHEPNQAYLASYKSVSQEPNQPYIAAYESVSHEPNQPYRASYNTVSQDSDQHVFYAKKAPKESAHDSTEQYITQYGDKKSSPKESTHASTEQYLTQYGYKKASKESVHDSTEQYITQYGDKKSSPKEFTDASTEQYVTQYGYKKAPKESAHDSTNQYITEYGDKKSSPKESTHASTEQYVTQYGYKKASKESAHDSTEQYITQYGDKKSFPKDSPKESVEPSSKVDHTEAFKAGFFSLDDLYVGNIMTLQFPIQEIFHFLPRKEADSIPFSLSQLASVLQLFSISEDSPQAISMRGTLEQCEAEPITGETKICATSLESILEFVGTIIGSEAKYNILTTSHSTTSGVPMQKFTISEVSQDIDAPKWVACHPLPYPYATYFCHFIATGSKVFKVSLSGENGDKVEALGICHLDTSDWNPSHILFKQLGIKAGKDPVCHFFPIKHLMWVPEPSKATM
ncbi:uncharacterized protein LOC133299445 [Gastrolobium bilobum]|uniref:uncharacterized protein LOC133299445 n=1 Tax=Gastrolobium bilobum TaxID=150636 RepID=UPI002AB186F3|nr:uncharacterized protein LOC133299445 [Gastrolobium bilobum]